MTSKTIVRNRKAWHDFEIMDKFEAGIALVGTEVKSIREGNIKITEAYCLIDDKMQLGLHELEISPYKFGNINNHDVRRVRKLLMHRREIIRLNAKIKEKGLTLIPLSMYYKKGIVKVEVAVCRGKKLHDKRASLKAKDAKLEMDRATKYR